MHNLSGENFVLLKRGMLALLKKKTENTEGKVIKAGIRI